MSEHPKGASPQTLLRQLCSRNGVDLSASKLSSSEAKSLYLLLALTGFLAGCSPYIQAHVAEQVITGQTTLPIDGVPSDVAGKLSPECTSVTITAGTDKVAGITIAPDFRSVTVSPQSGVEGPVQGTATVGHKGLFGCESDATIPFSGRIDTHPTTARETGVQGSSAVVAFDGDGQIFDSVTGQPIGAVNGGLAAIPLDGNRERTIKVVDSAGNTTTAELSAPVDCQQVPGEIRFDEASQHIQVGATCNGPGKITVPGGSDYPIDQGRHVWLGLPAGQKTATASILHKSWGSQMSLNLPAFRPPAAQVANWRIENGHVVAETACQTQVGDPCLIKVGPYTAQVKGDGKTVGRIEFAEQIGAGPQVSVQAQSSTGETADLGVVQLPAYQPFIGDRMDAYRATNGKIMVTITHPDSQHNLTGAPEVRGSQVPPFQSVPWASHLAQRITGTNDISCGLAAHNQDQSVFMCTAPYDRGPVNLWASVRDVNGNYNTLTGMVGIPDYTATEQHAVEAIPYATVLLLFAIAVSGAVYAVKDFQHRKGVEQKARTREFINASGRNAGDVAALEKPLRKAAAKKDREAAALLILLDQKRVLATIESRQRRQNQTFDAGNMLAFMDTCTAQDNESLKRQGYEPFVNEKETMGAYLMGVMDGFVESLSQERATKLKNPERVMAETLLEKVFREPDTSWFWKNAGRRQSQGTGGRRASTPLYPGLTRPNLRRAIINFYDLHGGLGSNRTKVLKLLGTPDQAQNGRPQDMVTILCEGSLPEKAYAYAERLTPVEKADAAGGFIQAGELDRAGTLLAGVEKPEALHRQAVQSLASSFAATIAEQIFNRLPRKRKLNQAMTEQEVRKELSAHPGLTVFAREITEAVLHLNTVQYANIR